LLLAVKEVAGSARTSNDDDALVECVEGDDGGDKFALETEGDQSAVGRKEEEEEDDDEIDVPFEGEIFFLLVPPPPPPPPPPLTLD
jgi:hypothetical protein